jgi:uncharacterized protein YajQ (UPF0234 family)
MPSFDIVSQIDMQEVDNAVNQTRREIEQRFDFRDSKTTIELNKKEKTITLLTEDAMRLSAIRQSLAGRMTTRKVDPRILEFGDEEPAGGMMLRQVVKLREGIERDVAKSIIKWVKESKLKVTAQIQDDQVRVEGKKIDDLQAVIAGVKSLKLEVPLQFINMKN